MLIKKNDMVIVRSGKYRGQKGKVLTVNNAESLVTVDGVSEVYRHVRRSQKNMQGGRLSKLMPIQMSNVMIICQKCQKPTRVGTKFDASGKKVRFCKKCQSIIE